MVTDFYRAFEDRHRGSREAIKSRLRVYLPFVEPLKALHPGTPALDLGCGRGEWLELLVEAEVSVRGIDTNDAMLATCREAGLSAAKADAVEALKAEPSESLALVSGFHLAEHIVFSDLQELVRQSLRALKPGGLLILETPNPENIVVGTAGFYLDPTHRRPLPPGLLAFLPEHAGFRRTKVARLQEAPWLKADTATSVLSVLRDTSADYAVVAQKAASDDELAAFDVAFARELGLTLEAVATYYDAHIESRARQVESGASRAQARADEAEGLARLAQDEAARARADALATLTSAQQALAASQAAEQAARAAQAGAEQAQLRIQELLASKSWRLTAPLRALVNALNALRGK